MSVPDSAEYWDDLHGYSTAHRVQEKKIKYKPLTNGFKPCPICGKLPKIYNNTTYFKAVCKAQTGKHIDHELVMYGDTLDELRERWNRRV